MHIMNGFTFGTGTVTDWITLHYATPFYSKAVMDVAALYTISTKLAVFERRTTGMGTRGTTKCMACRMPGAAALLMG